MHERLAQGAVIRRRTPEGIAGLGAAACAVERGGKDRRLLTRGMVPRREVGGEQDVDARTRKGRAVGGILRDVQERAHALHHSDAAGGDGVTLAAVFHVEDDVSGAGLTRERDRRDRMAARGIRRDCHDFFVAARPLEGTRAGKGEVLALADLIVQLHRRRGVLGARTVRGGGVERIVHEDFHVVAVRRMLRVVQTDVPAVVEPEVAILNLGLVPLVSKTARIVLVRLEEHAALDIVRPAAAEVGRLVRRRFVIGEVQRVSLFRPQIGSRSRTCDDHIRVNEQLHRVLAEIGGVVDGGGEARRQRDGRLLVAAAHNVGGIARLAAVEREVRAHDVVRDAAGGERHRVLAGFHALRADPFDARAALERHLHGHGLAAGLAVVNAELDLGEVEPQTLDVGQDFHLLVCADVRSGERGPVGAAERRGYVLPVLDARGQVGNVDRAGVHVLHGVEEGQRLRDRIRVLHDRAGDTVDAQRGAVAAAHILVEGQGDGHGLTAVIGARRNADVRHRHVGFGSLRHKAKAVQRHIGVGYPNGEAG